jgi:hypothetical protein
VEDITAHIEEELMHSVETSLLQMQRQRQMTHHRHQRQHGFVEQHGTRSASSNRTTTTTTNRSFGLFKDVTATGTAIPPPLPRSNPRSDPRFDVSAFTGNDQLSTEDLATAMFALHRYYSPHSPTEAYQALTMVGFRICHYFFHRFLRFVACSHRLMALF